MKNLFNPGKIGDLLCLLAGAIMPLAFAPFYFYPLAIIAPALLLMSWLHVTPKQAAWRGWLFGLGMFGAGVSWVYISIHVYGNTVAPLAALFTLILVAFLACYVALQGYLFTTLFPRNHYLKIILVFPILWVLMEWLRSWVLTGFPWILIGYSQTASPLKGFIPLMGEYGVAFLLLFTSGYLVFLCRQYKNLIAWVGGIIIFLLIWGGGYLLQLVSWTHPVGKPLTVALVQGNIAQDIKWTPEHIIPTLKIYYEFTRTHWNNDIIIWPEASIPIPYSDAKEFLTKLSAEAASHQTSLIVGLPVEVPNSFSYYNAMMAIGDGQGSYYKRHLVPFGEYVPFERVLRGAIAFLNIPMSDMISGPVDQQDLVAANLKIAPSICYEIAYSNDLLQELPQAKLLVTISNDAWFGRSLALYQHLQIGQFRAIQSGRELLFSGNNGITAIINSHGEVVKRIAIFSRAVLVGSVQPMSGSTPWIHYGDLPIILIMLGILLILIMIQRRQHASA